MKIIRKIFKWIKKNRKWVFSGIGVTILSLLFNMLFNSKDNTIDIDNTRKEMNNINVDGDVHGNVYQNSTIYNLNEDIENKQETEKERDESSSFQTVIDFEKNKHWSEKHIIGIPYEPDSNVLKWINAAKDYTNDWEDYEPQLVYHNGDKELEYAKLVGKTENFFLYDIFIKNGSMLIKTSEDSYVLAEGIPSTSTTGGSPQPLIMEADYDNDGDNELAIRVWLLHGTGESIDSLFIVDKASDGCWYMFQFLYKDYLNVLYKEYDSKTLGDNLYFVWNDSVIDIPQKLENKTHFDYYCVGEIVDIEYCSEEIIMKLEAGYNVDDYWDYSIGHGISAKVHYQGEGKWELAEYDYYNDSLEKYVTKIMDLYLKKNMEALEQECDFTFPTFDSDVTEYDIVKIIYDSSKFGNDTFRVDVYYTVDNIGITFHAILTIKQIDSSYSSDTGLNILWKICDLMITE